MLDRRFAAVDFARRVIGERWCRRQGAVVPDQRVQEGRLIAFCGSLGVRSLRSASAGGPCGRIAETVTGRPAAAGRRTRCGGGAGRRGRGLRSRFGGCSPTWVSWCRCKYRGQRYVSDERWPPARSGFDGAASPIAVAQVTSCRSDSVEWVLCCRRRAPPAGERFPFTSCYFVGTASCGCRAATPSTT